MSLNTNRSKLDQTQIVQRAFDESKDRLRVDAELSVDSATVVVETNYATDSMAIGDPNTNNILKVNADGSIDANVVVSAANDSIKVSDGVDTLEVNADGSINSIVTGSVSISNFPASQAVTGPLTDTELRATPVPISGSVTANAGTNLNTSALALETTLSAMSAKLTSATGTIIQVPRSTATQVAVAANANRKGCLFANDSGAICYVAYAATASSTAYSFRLTSNAFYEMAHPVYTGVISVIFASGTGSPYLNITELS